MKVGDTVVVSVSVPDNVYSKIVPGAADYRHVYTLITDMYTHMYGHVYNACVQACGYKCVRMCIDMWTGGQCPPS